VEEGEELEITPKFADEPTFTQAEITSEDVVLVEEAKEEDNVLIITDQGEETTSTSPTTLPPQEEDSLPPNKYHLFERLLSFLDTDQTPLNPVLSGYFSKLLLMLI
jgi:hypothetical protein